VEDAVRAAHRRAHALLLRDVAADDLRAQGLERGGVAALADDRADGVAARRERAAAWNRARDWDAA
jgi:hypothetical protein